MLTASMANAAENWLEFRGPDGAGHTDAANLPLKWGPRRNVAWRTPLEGEGWSSPVISEGRIYLTSAVVKDEDSKDRSLRVLKLDAKSGKVLRDVEVFQQDGATAPKIHSKNSHASPTPLLHDDRVYVHFGHQGTAALDLDLNVVWKKVFRYPPVHGNGGTPIIADDKLIFSCDGARDPFIVALNLENGEEAWRTSRKSDARKKFSFATAQAIEVDGQTQIISPGSNVVYALDPADGSVIWQVRYDGYSVIPRPVYGDGMLFVATGYDRPSVIAIRVDGQGDVTDTHVAWTVQRGAPHTPSLLLHESELFMVSDRGIASCLDAATGEVIWQERLGGNFSSSPLLAGDRIYFQDEKGKATVVKAARKFEVLAENDLKERTLASYAPVDGALFIRTAEALYRIEEN